ncbi:MAG: bifunctional DNA primase/polymerase, partial [Acidobacteria bacterium]|nr:bifunctional DNA primase/polymerase [Acidobacteriota bacterium]
MPTTTMLDHALAYAARGWRVHPLRARDKTPASKHGCKDATTDETQIRAWWAKFPNANIGLATGYEFFAIDIDPAGMAWYEAEQLPATHEAVTGRGGRHVLYRMPTGYVIGNSAGLLAE